jgi:hypothetical protein
MLKEKRGKEGKRWIRRRNMTINTSTDLCYQTAS